MEAAATMTVTVASDQRTAELVIVRTIAMRRPTVARTVRVDLYRAHSTSAAQPLAIVVLDLSFAIRRCQSFLAKKDSDPAILSLLHLVAVAARFNDPLDTGKLTMCALASATGFKRRISIQMD